MPTPTKGYDQLIYQFRNCRLLKSHEIICDDLWVRNGIILNPEKLFFDEKSSADIQIDCNNAIISPGFIDVQINGGYGVDFSLASDDIEGGLLKVSKELLAHGVTSFCPTIVTSPVSVYKQIIPCFKRRNGGRHGAGIIGLHLEGPFISKVKKGAHPVECIRRLETGFQDLLDVYGELDEVAIVTLAPEYPNSPQVIRELVNRGIVVSVGHSEANLVDGEEAVKHGASFITHLFNAMLPFHHRDPHLVGLLSSTKLGGKSVYYGLIADGIHTHPAAIRIAHRVNPHGLVLVTDAIPAMGLSAGKHTIGQMSVEIIDKNKAVIAGTDTLCGSIITMDQCVRKFLKSAGCTIVEALEAASVHPAEALNIANMKGTLEYGSDADFLLLDDELNVQATYIAGTLVWENPTTPTRTEKSIGNISAQFSLQSVC